MRLVWHSNAPWNVSGYGLMTSLFVPRMASLGHDVVISAPYSFGGAVLQWGDWPVIPCVRDTAGNDTLIQNHEFHKADWTITLSDVFGLQKVAEHLRQINVAHLFPVDTNPLAEGDVAVLRDGGGVPVAISQFGRQVLKAEGADPLYAPHGIDTGIFSPGDPEPYRATVAGLGSDTWVAGVVGMNRDPLRKGIPEMMLAFSRFHARHPDSHLALHTAQIANPGLNLPGLAARLGIGACVSYPDAYLYDTGQIDCSQMAAFYRGLDVLLMTSYGEGFGLPAVEAQACGVPVILTDASAQSELCGSGWLVSGSPFWSSGHGAWWKRPDVDDIEQALEQAFLAREDGKMPALKESARAFALTYDIDVVFEKYMVPVLADLEARIA